MKTVVSEIYSGKTLARAFMNRELSTLHLIGLAIDVGGGSSASYLDFIPREKGTKIITVDKVAKNGTTIDLEMETIPFEENTADTVFILNLLEHIFNHNHVIQESLRITKKGGSLVGYVPFLVRYHPHPHDYFRYTKEALERILQNAGWQEIVVRECGTGPFLVVYHTFMLFVPRFMRVLLWYPTYWLNSMYLKFRPHTYDRYPLGYTFYAKK